MLSKFSWQLGLIAIVTIIPICSPSAMARKPRVAAPAPKAVNIPAGKNADDYYLESGWEKYQSGDFQGALTDYSRVIELCSTTCNGAFGSRGDTKSQLGDYQGALADYNQAIKSSDNYTKSNAYTGRGAIKANVLNDYQGALADFNRAIKIYPQNVTARTNIINVRKEMSGENSEAREQDRRRRYGAIMSIPVRQGGTFTGK
jgi:tetratricopeptide (TPR) repeat protein